jgi:predicted GIY-YIG superfamily endonuclease
MQDKATDLYRHFDADGTLLYVGISLSAIARLKQHKNAAGWRGKIAQVTIETLPSREAALDAESAAIKTERPLWNKHHATRTENDVERIAAALATHPAKLTRGERRLLAAHIVACNTGNLANWREMWHWVQDYADAYGIKYSKAHSEIEETLRTLEARDAGAGFATYGGFGEDAREPPAVEGEYIQISLGPDMLEIIRPYINEYFERQEKWLDAYQAQQTAEATQD